MNLRPYILTGIVTVGCAGCVVPPPRPMAYAQPVAPVQNCRPFQNTIMIDGKPQQATGTVCQQPDGSWQVADSQPSQPAPQVVAAQPYPYPAYSYPYPYPYYGAYPYSPGYYYGAPVSIGVGFGFGGHRRW